MIKRMTLPSLLGFAMTCLITVLPASADVITTYSDRTTFNNAVGGPLTIEDFTDTDHFPITSGVLNSETSEPGATGGGINPGDIQPGVTYSTPVGTGNFFNIDAGGGYTGGFLDGFEPSDRDLTIVFWDSAPNDAQSISAFGFDTLQIGGGSDFDVLISFDSGPDQLFNFSAVAGFYGFQSDLSDISSVVISNNGSFFGFDLDNFTFGKGTVIPEPSSLLLVTLGALGFLVRRRRSL